MQSICRRSRMHVFAWLSTLIAAVAWFAPATEAKETRAVERESYGAIIRGPASEKRLSLVFTGDEFGESAAPILDALRQRKIKASFFLTGKFVRDPKLRPLAARMIAEGHYLGPHSNGHLLYCDWAQRDRSLVTKEEFSSDLEQNVAGLRDMGALRDGRTVYFMPPYEWYNRDQAVWASEMELSPPAKIVLINFTPGSGSNRDYAREGDPRFVPAQKIYDDILAYEEREERGLRGFILLLHLGSGRKDPFHPLVGKLCDELKNRGYEAVRIDELLED